MVINDSGSDDASASLKDGPSQFIVVFFAVKGALCQISAQKGTKQNICDFSLMLETRERISAIPISSDATFTDLRNAYRGLSADFSKESMHETCGGSPVPKILIRLLTEFLRDPDIQAGWSAEDFSVN